VNRLRPFRRTYLAWGRWWAVQFVAGEIGGFGVRPVLTRPMLDLYLGPLTISLGRHPIMTEPDQRERFSCRGFLVADRAVF
jgi:hypothetical protein